ncbi:hypothetical protein FB00_02630 [Cellulosimicrobium funkei]|uniref:DUF1684 domain-containing protein n=1 Tax=Cellulosimicrobium funkei TaxID=264251 RepID=A0A0H2KRU9_9MICO|nr:DUF1684 domain-containing protein [Cellulosimicrobium funkei]KLN35913.1 hypothetical protein FB00_02630 [Cellulosimicrobium funkei]
MSQSTLTATGAVADDPAAPGPADDTQDAAAWAAWHAEREEGLRPPHGWLSLVAYHWLPAEPAALPGVPGLWWADADGAHHRAGEGGAVRATTGDSVGTVAVTEGGSSVAGTFLPGGRDAGDPADGGETREVAVEVVRRTGRYAVRLRDPLAPARTGFDGVPTFAYDPAWVVDAAVRWYDAPRPVVVGAARPGLVHHVSTVGEVDLVVERDGVSHRATLVLTGKAGGAVTLLFSDEADGVAPWRVLWVDADVAPGTEGRVRLDLNRVINLPYAFSDFGTCPAPVEGNHVPFAVTAGERAPR